MKKLIMTAAIAAAIASPSLALAADSSMSNMATAPAPVYMCHTSGTGETTNSMMGTTHLTCAMVDMVKMRGAIKSMRAMQMDASTKAQVDALEKMITFGQNESTGG